MHQSSIPSSIFFESSKEQMTTFPVYDPTTLSIIQTPGHILPRDSMLYECRLARSGNTEQAPTQKDADQNFERHSHTIQTARLWQHDDVVPSWSCRVVIIRPPHIFPTLSLVPQPRPPFQPPSPPRLQDITNDLFGDLHSSCGIEHFLQVAVDGELTGGKGADHEQTGTKTGVRATNAKLLRDLDQTGSGTLARSAY
jgi:hypothetical protein